MANAGDKEINQNVAALFGGLYQLHRMLYLAGRTKEAEEVTAMSLRLRQIANNDSNTQHVLGASKG